MFIFNKIRIFDIKLVLIVPKATVNVCFLIYVHTKRFWTCKISDQKDEGKVVQGRSVFTYGGNVYVYPADFST